MSLVESPLVSPWHRSADRRSLWKRIEDALRAHPEGITCKALGEVLGEAQYTVSGQITKMKSYGQNVKMRRENGKPIWWWVE